MGSISRMNRCERFIKEFSQLAVKRYGLENPRLISQSLGCLDWCEVVRLFCLLRQKGGDVGLVNMTESKAKERLKKAQRIDD